MKMRFLSCRYVLSVAVAFGLAACATTPTRADTFLYATSQEGNQLDKVDLTTNTVTNILNTSSQADSLLFDTNGNIIYSQNNSGDIRIFNPNTLSDQLIVNLAGNPVDMALEPGGNSLLVSLFNGGQIDRINLQTYQVSVLGTYGGNPEGITYDSQGRLFVNLGTRDGNADKYVAQIDPVTGAVLATSAHYTSLDGLTYDSSTGMLYAASLFGNNIVKVDPNNLANSSILGNSGVGNPDGIESDGQGHLYIASRADYHIYSYDLGASRITQMTKVYGLDDIAPVTGLGSPVPEPSSLTLLAGLLAMAGLGAWVRGRSNRGGPA